MPTLIIENHTAATIDSVPYWPPHYTHWPFSIQEQIERFASDNDFDELMMWCNRTKANWLACNCQRGSACEHFGHRSPWK